MSVRGRRVPAAQRGEVLGAERRGVLGAAVVVPVHGGQRLGAVRVVRGVVLDERAVVQPGFEVLRPGALVAPAAGLMGSHARASLEWVRPPAGAGDQ